MNRKKIVWNQLIKNLSVLSKHSSINQFCSEVLNSLRKDLNSALVNPVPFSDTN